MEPAVTRRSARLARHPVPMEPGAVSGGVRAELEELFELIEASGLSARHRRALRDFATMLCMANRLDQRLDLKAERLHQKLDDFAARIGERVI